MEDHYLRKTAAQVDDLLDKIDGVEAHAEVNQNAYSKVKVGNVNVEASSKTATIEFAEGSNVTITPNALTGVVTFSATDTTYSVATDSADGLMSSTDKVKLDSLATVATSGSYADLSNKPTIPDELSDLQDDTTHRLVTDTEKSTWNAKSDFSGSYTDLTNKPTIPDELSDLQDDTTHRLVTDTEKSTWNAKSDFSGSYTDLTDKPTIPDELSDLQDDTTHRLVTDTEKSTWNAKSDFSGSYTDLTDKPTLGTASAKNYDSTVTQSSTNLVEGGAVYTELGLKIAYADLPSESDIDDMFNGTYTS